MGRGAGEQDGRRIVSGSDDKSIRVWDVETGEELLQLQGHAGSVNSVAISSVWIVREWGSVQGRQRSADAIGHGGGAQDRRRIVSGSDDKSVRVWDAEMGAELLQLQGHTGSVNSVAVSAVRRAGSQC
eukprot:tig00000523_g1858.t1